MDFGNLVGQMLQQGLGGRTNDRLTHATGTDGLGAQGGIDEMLGGLLGSLSGDGAGTSPAAARGGPEGLGGTGAGDAGGLGGLLGGLGEMLSTPSGVGSMSRGQVGGLGALAGAVLGGGSVRGAVGGGAMALLGTLALSALKNWQAGQAGQMAAPGEAASSITEEEAQQITAPETAELCLKGMIAAAKADGQISQDEMSRIMGKLEEGGVTDEERQLVLEEMSKPLDLEGLAQAIPNRQVGAQVYAASLMAIKLDSPSEQAYMQALASRIGLDGGSVRRLHQLVGVA